jgi:hypothetical protein
VIFVEQCGELCGNFARLYLLKATRNHRVSFDAVMCSLHDMYVTQCPFHGSVEVRDFQNVCRNRTFEFQNKINASSNREDSCAVSYAAVVTSTGFTVISWVQVVQEMEFSPTNCMGTLPDCILKATCNHHVSFDAVMHSVHDMYVAQCRFMDSSDRLDVCQRCLPAIWLLSAVDSCFWLSVLCPDGNKLVYVVTYNYLVWGDTTERCGARMGFCASMLEMAMSLHTLWFDAFRAFCGA